MVVMLTLMIHGIYLILTNRIFCSTIYSYIMKLVKYTETQKHTLKIRGNTYVF